MKRFLPLAIVAVVAGGIAFGVTQWCRHAHCPDEIAWLRQEFSLTDAQVTAIKKIRSEYGTICEQNCGKLSGAKKRLVETEKADGKDSSTYRTALAHFETVSRECEKSTRRHLEAIAAQMPPDAGQRYLEIVGPKLTSSTSPSSK